MSRLSTMSPEAIKAVFSSETDSDLILLFTVFDPDNPNQVIARFCDGYTQRLETLTTDEQVVYGIVSRGNNFIFLPIQITLPGEDEANTQQASITIYDVTQYVVPIMRTLTGPPKVLMEMVLSKSPDTVEISFNNFYISNFKYNAESVSINLSMIDYSVEPFPQYSFTPNIFPGLF